jgi:hypothetical protein
MIVNGSLDQCFLGYHFEEWQYWSSALFNKPRYVSSQTLVGILILFLCVLIRLDLV